MDFYYATLYVGKLEKILKKCKKGCKYYLLDIKFK